MSSQSLTQPFENQQLPSDGLGKDERFGYIIVNDNWNEIAVGDTIIGRDASVCSIVIPDNTLSKVHAIIESEGAEDSFIYDVGSTNGSKIGRMVLKPHCRYKMNDNDTILLGNTAIQFRITSHKVKINSNLPKLKTEEEKQGFEGIPSFTKKSSISDKNILVKINLSTPMKSQKKFYYKTDSDSSLVDIFNQPTQCMETNVNHNLIDDEIDIYNLSTQCDYPIKPSSAKLKEKSELDKTVNCSLNNLRSFSILDNSKSVNCGITDTCKFNDDIFDLATQCQFNEGVKVSEKSETNDKAPENLRIFNCKDNSCKVNNHEVGCCERNFNLEKFSESLLCDGADEALCEVMNIYSQPSVKNNKKLKPLISDAVKITSDKNNSTQEHTAENQTDCKEITASDGVVDKSKGSGDHVRVKNKGSVIQASSTSLGAGTEKIISENMILTQDFNASFKISKSEPEKHCKTSDGTNESHVIEKKSGTDDVYKLLQEDTELEDLIATQIFHSVNVCSSEKLDKSSQMNCSEDDIATQIFPYNNTEKNHEDIVVKEKYIGRVEPIKNISGNINGSGIPHMIDSGDEAESDFEKLCLESSVIKNKKEFVVLNESSVRPGTSSANGFDTRNTLQRRRSSSESTDKTVSDLDVDESGETNINNVQKPSESLSEDASEDFIATQLFPVGLNEKESRSNLTLAGDRLQSSKQNTEDRLEDLIPTQVFPSGGLRNDEIINSKEGATSCGGLDIICIDDIDDSSNESESLIKDLQMSKLENTIKKEIKTATNLFVSVSAEANGARESHEVHVVSESEETDCEELVTHELDRWKCFIQTSENVPKIIDLTLSNTLLEDENEGQQISPRLIRTIEEKSDQGNPTASHTEINKKSRVLETPTKDLKQSSKTPSFLGDTDANQDASLKRGQTSSVDEAIPNKRLKNRARERDIDGRKTCPDLSDEIVLTQSRKLRNRLIKRTNQEEDRRKLKKSVPSLKSPNKDRLISEVDLENILTAGYDGKSTRQKSIKKRELETRNRTARKLHIEFSSCAQEDGRSSRTRKRVGNVKDSAKEYSVFKIVFTGFESESHNRIIGKLGGQKVNDLREGDVLVTDKVRRTVKFLSAIARGLPVVSPKWIVMSGKEGRFLDPWDFLLEDKLSEERWGFNLRNAIEEWREKKLLSGYSVYATMSTKPPIPEILGIIDCCGGTPLPSRPNIWPAKSIVLTCEEDRESWPSTKARNVKIVHYEFLLSGVLRYVLDFKKYKLR